ncbi:ZIP family metal transporter [Candidatus Nomurabacteria bacterium]|nr:ZIP family metal transporter [Candidatus Nomurabacteria bacterium]
MVSLWTVIFFSLVGGVLSLSGGFLLISNKKTAGKFSNYATPFAAGALLSAAFVDLLPEASHVGDAEKALTYTLIGIIGFFILERFLHWFHHHHVHDENGPKDPTVSLLVIGDTLHNFIDGIAIGSAFLLNSQTGIVVTLAVAAHEIPQEIGDFGLMLDKGMSRLKVIYVNIFSALATTVAAIIFFKLGDSHGLSLDGILGLIAGMFIYIAVSDIIPTIHENEAKKIAGPQTIMLLVGVIGVSLLTNFMHQYIDTDSHEPNSSSTVINQ